VSEPEKLPLDSPNWITVEDAYQSIRRVSRYVGYPSLAANDLEAAVRDGRVPAMRKCFLLERELIGPERELLPLAHWDERRLFVRSNGSLEVVEGSFRFRSLAIRSVKGYAYFVWKPRLAKVWPDLFAPTAAAKIDDAQPAQPQRRREPPPEHEWSMEVAREVIQRERAGQPMPTAPQMLDWCRNKWDWEPDIRQMQKLLRKLLSS
jgi:hypothetical protein